MYVFLWVDHFFLLLSKICCLYMCYNSLIHFFLWKDILAVFRFFFWDYKGNSYNLYTKCCVAIFSNKVSNIQEYNCWIILRVCLFVFVWNYQIVTQSVLTHAYALAYACVHMGACTHTQTHINLKVLTVPLTLHPW